MDVSAVPALFDFSGRSRRLEYWLFTLFFYIATILFVVLIIGGLPFDQNMQIDENNNVHLAFRSGLALAA